MNHYDYDTNKTTKARGKVTVSAAAEQAELFNFDASDLASAPVAYVPTVTAPTNEDTTDSQTPAPPKMTGSDQTPPPAAPAAAAIDYTRPAILTTKGAVSLEVAAVRDLAMSVGEGAISDRLKAELQDAILEVATMKALFITADVKTHLGPRYSAIKDPRVIGPIMKGMQKTGLIKPTGQMLPSPDPANHGRFMRVWTRGEMFRVAVSAGK